ncbi:MAG: hypothetical protein V7629_21275 [Motiliproteus sp.]
MKFKDLFVLPLVFLFSVTANAALNNPSMNFAANYQSSEPSRVYLAGSLGGLETANAQLRADERLSLYCVPTTLRLNAENAVSIFEDELAIRLAGGIVDWELWPKVPLEQVLLWGLKRTFPC